MNLTEFMTNKLLHGHIIVNDNKYITKLIHLDCYGNILNTYYYSLNYINGTSKFKLAITEPTDTVYTYKYVIDCKNDYNLCMILSIPSYTSFTYKVYNLDSMQFMWFDEQDLHRFDEQDQDIHIHNRIFSIGLDNVEHFKDFLVTAQYEFKKLFKQLNLSLQNFINKNNIDSVKSISLDEFITNHPGNKFTIYNEDTKQTYSIDIPCTQDYSYTNRISSIVRNYFYTDQINRVKAIKYGYIVNSDDNNITIIKLGVNNIIYVGSFNKSEINDLKDPIYSEQDSLTLYDKDFNDINHRLLRALLLHRISTDEYNYLRKNLYSFFSH